jgi:hypothetical protein
MANVTVDFLIVGAGGGGGGSGCGSAKTGGKGGDGVIIVRYGLGSDISILSPIIIIG